MIYKIAWSIRVPYVRGLLYKDQIFWSQMSPVCHVNFFTFSFVAGFTKHQCSGRVVRSYCRLYSHHSRHDTCSLAACTGQITRSEVRTTFMFQ